LGRIVFSGFGEAVGRFNRILRINCGVAHGIPLKQSPEKCQKPSASDGPSGPTEPPRVPFDRTLGGLWVFASGAALLGVSPELIYEAAKPATWAHRAAR
jgi:hypothetical protein